MCCWRKLLRVPWTVKRSNQLILKEINTEYSFERLRLKLQLQYFGYPAKDAKSRLIGKDPDARKDWRQEEKETTEDKMVNSITDSTDMSLSKLWEIVKDRWAWRVAVYGVTKSRTQLSTGWRWRQCEKMLNIMHNKGSEILSYTDTICHLLEQQRSKSLIAPDLVRVWDSSYFAGRSVILVPSPWKTTWWYLSKL